LRLRRAQPPVGRGQVALAGADVGRQAAVLESGQEVSRLDGVAFRLRQLGQAAGLGAKIVQSPAALGAMIPEPVTIERKVSGAPPH
jgi:hypothetical protein